MSTLRLARFLAEVRKRSRQRIPDEIDPLGVLFSRVAMNRYNTEGRALGKAALAVITAEGEMTEADLWALGQDALGMLDAFAARRLAGGYALALLNAVGAKLKTILDESAI